MAKRNTPDVDLTPEYIRCPYYKRRQDAKRQAPPQLLAKHSVLPGVLPEPRHEPEAEHVYDGPVDEVQRVRDLAEVPRVGVVEDGAQGVRARRRHRVHRQRAADAVDEPPVLGPGRGDEVREGDVPWRVGRCGESVRARETKCGFIPCP